MTRGRQKILISVAMLALGAALGLGLRQAQRSLADLRHEHGRLAVGMRALKAEHLRLREDERVLAQRAELRAREASDTAKRVAQEKKMGELRQMLTTLRASRSGSSPHALWRPYPRGKHGDIFAELLADPDYAQLYASYERINVETRHADFFATTSVTPAALAKLKGVLVQRAISDLEREELIVQHQVPAGQTAELMNFLAEKFEAEIREILGEAGRAEFWRHLSTGSQRTSVEAIARRLSYSDDPLQAAQAASLVTILAGVKESYISRMLPAEKIDGEIIKRAGAVLTPAQCERLKEFFQEQQAAALQEQAAARRR